MADSISGKNSTYFDALAFTKELGATRGIDAALKEYSLDALILPAQGLATIPAGESGSFDLVRPLFLTKTLFSKCRVSHCDW